MRVRALTDIRPNPDGTLFQRIAAAFLDQKRYRQSLSTLIQEFAGWKLEEATEAVEPLLSPAPLTAFLRFEEPQALSQSS